jgi:carbonic anhydrase
VYDVIFRFDPAASVRRQPPADAAEAWRRLEEGNATFARLPTDARSGSHVVYVAPEDLGVCPAGGTPTQQPFAAVLGCSDARVPIELIFDRSCNELFVVRVAGNILGLEQLGSIDYALEHLGRHLKLLVVLGHSQCGAVSAAVDAFLKPGDYLGLVSSHPLRALVNSLFPPVRGAAVLLAGVWGDDIVKRPGYRAALIETAVTINAALKATILQQGFPDPSADRRVVFGVYDLRSRRVRVPRPFPDGGEDDTRLVEAPPGREEFRQFGVQVAGSPLVRRLLEG